ncbi:MAG: DUF3465 domain-containing protein [Pseudomonadales bacterium]
MIKKLLAVIVLLGAAYASLDGTGIADRFSTDTPASTSGSAAAIEAAYQSHRSDVQVGGVGEVVRVLADDRDGSRHQRFILRLNSGRTLLVAHNIDLAPRIPGLAAGDRVEFYGEYEWNERGGVLHWTHHDPQGRHPDGWLKHGGRTYR